MESKPYSWGEFYETTIACEGYTEEQRKRFAVFEALDKAACLEEIFTIIKPLTENEINWLNSPCLDGIIFSLPLCGRIHSPIYIIVKNKKDEYHETCRYFLQKRLTKRCLYSACRHGVPNIVKVFIEQKANIHKNNDCALRTASIYGRTEIVKLLLENGADIHAESGEALRNAVMHGYPETVKLLLENGADVHTRLDEALYMACTNGNIEIAKLLIQYKADIRASYDRSLRTACACKHAEIAKLLLENGADIHAEGDECIFNACEEGNLEIVKLLLSHGADPDNGLGIAIMNRRTSIVLLLLENGAKIHTYDSTPLLNACIYTGGTEIVELLLHHGSIITNGIVTWVFTNELADMFELLVKRGARIDHLYDEFPTRVRIMKTLFDNSR